MRISSNTKRQPVKNLYRILNSNSKTETTKSIIFNKYERRRKMELSRKNNQSQKAATLVLLIIFSLISLFSGCGNTNLTGIQDNGSGSSASGENIKPGFKDSTIIKLDMSLSFKSETISDSKLLESNIGNKFNHIVSFKRELKPGGELDLQDLQPAGIFGLYISSDGSFTLSNSDGMSFSTKSLLMEKCSFIDLKVSNHGQKTINVTGFAAGE